MTEKKLDKNAQNVLKYIRSITDFKPQVALILGSGLGEFSDNIEIVSSILSSEIINYPVSSVNGHAGKLIFGYLKNDFSQSMPLLIFQGRIHFMNLDHLTGLYFQ